MKTYIEKRKAEILSEAIEELELCNLEWDDSFYTYWEYTPNFEDHEQTNANFFYGCMARIEELDKLLKDSLPKPPLQTFDDVRDLAIQIVDECVEQELIVDCTDTENETEFAIQDIITDKISKQFNISRDE